MAGIRRKAIFGGPKDGRPLLGGHLPGVGVGQLPNGPTIKPPKGGQHNPGGNNNNGGRKPHGGTGGKKGGVKRKQGGPLYKRARNDVNLANQPYLDAIHQAQIQARQQYHQDSQRVGDLYSALQNQLAPLSGQYATQSQGIASDLQGQIGGLAGLLGSNVAGVPAEEIAAGTNAVGAQGTGALEMLASDRSRNIGYNTSAQRQGGIENLTARRNYLQDFQDLRDQMAGRKLDVKSSIAAQIRQRLNELRDQQFQQTMAEKQFGLSQADQSRLNRATNASISAQQAAQQQQDQDRAAWWAWYNGGQRGPEPRRP